MISRNPTYNLTAVLRETGIKADALRAWEKRYELPNPQRSPGGHRLYSHYDIEIIKWLRARQEEGLTISRAVDLWKELTAAGHDPIEEAQASPTPMQPELSIPDTRIDGLRKLWLDACLEFDWFKAEEIMNQAFALYNVETVCTEVLQAGLSVVGELWHQGKATVQQEHFASVLAIRRLEALISASPTPIRPQVVLLGCPAGENHTFPVLLLNLLLRRRGYKVVYLGADVPVAHLKETAAAIGPDLIVMAAQQLTSAAALASAARDVAELNIPTAYGGLIFNREPALRDRIPAWFLGESIDQSIQKIEYLLANPALFPMDTSVEAGAHIAVQHFREQRPLIQVALLNALRENGVSIEYLGEANAHFGDRLVAALELGDPALIEKDLEWINWLLSGWHVPAGLLIPYLRMYSQAVRSVMGSDGEEITNWIDAYIESH